MFYNNDTFGSENKILTDSPYVNNNWDESLLPPPLSFFLLDDSGQELLDDSNTHLLTP